MQYLLIALMGFIGALCRFALGSCLDVIDFPVGTLMINLIGCFTLEIIYGYVGRRLHVRRDMVRAMGVGLLGAFSTMSAFCAESVQMLVVGDYLGAILYITATFLGCFLAALAGHFLCRYLSARRLKRYRMMRQKRHHIEPDGGERRS